MLNINASKVANAGSSNSIKEVETEETFLVAIAIRSRGIAEENIPNVINTSQVFRVIEVIVKFPIPINIMITPPQKAPRILSESVNLI